MRSIRQHLAAVLFCGTAAAVSLFLSPATCRADEPDIVLAGTSIDCVSDAEDIVTPGSDASEALLSDDDTVLESQTLCNADGSGPADSGNTGDPSQNPDENNAEPGAGAGSENGSGREHAAGLENWGRAAEGGPILFSAKDGTGLKELKERVEEMFFAGKLNGSEDAWVANARQRTALAAARTSLGLVAESIRAGVPEDMYTIDLADAYRELGYIIGEEVEDELIDKIFADFCMGK